MGETGETTEPPTPDALRGEANRSAAGPRESAPAADPLPTDPPVPDDDRAETVDDGSRWAVYDATAEDWVTPVFASEADAADALSVVPGHVYTLRRV